MGVSAGQQEDLPESVVIELRRTAAELLGHVASYADDMLAYILERIPEASADEELRGRVLVHGVPDARAVAPRARRERLTIRLVA